MAISFFVAELWQFYYQYLSAEVAKSNKFQILNEYHDRTDKPQCFILSKVIVGLELCQQNQRYGYSEDLLESYWMSKLPKSPKICQTLQKSQFSSGSKSKKSFYCKIGSLLYLQCAWCCSQKRKIKCFSSIICMSLGAENRINFEIVG